MKKLILSAMAVCAFGLASAQEGGFKVGVHAGMPMGDAGDMYSFNFGADVAYLWEVADGFKAGVTTGYSYFSGKEYDEAGDLGDLGDWGDWGDLLDDMDIPGGGKVKVNGAFIPVAATGQYSFSDNFFGGADLGYALYAGDGDGDGGFYYQPKVGYQTEKIEVFVSYKGISADGASISTLGAGFAYKF